MSDIASTRNDPRRAAPPLPDEVQEWRRGRGFASLRARIFAVNIFAVIVLALMLLYIDTVRARLLDERTTELARQAVTIAGFAADLPVAALVPSLQRRSFDRGTRVRLYSSDGVLLADNWRGAGVRRFLPDDPAKNTWRRRSARAIDRVLEDIGSFESLPAYREAQPDNAAQWPEIARATLSQTVETRLRRADDGNFVIAAAAPVAARGGAIHVTDSAVDLTRILRAERLTSFWLLLGVTGMTLLLSFYLARTIVRPLRMLAIAAHRVRLGRSREVIVPRLPDRRDEIGALARALSDMSIALRLRIDATEAFAADV
ncbi:MAG: stimulus-sensing domain-containing protein, partial [Polymorphobacter sp.]